MLMWLQAPSLGLFGQKPPANDKKDAGQSLSVVIVAYSHWYLTLAAPSAFSLGGANSSSVPSALTPCMCIFLVYADW